MHRGITSLLMWVLTAGLIALALLERPLAHVTMAGPLVPFIPLIIGAAGSVLKGIGDSRPRTATSTSTSTTEQSQRGVRNRDQRQLARQLADILRGALTQGPTVSQSDRNAGRTNINNTFGGIRGNLESALTSRGFGQSGKMGAGFKGLEIARSNAFQGLESNLRSEAQQRFERMLGLTSGFIQPHMFESSSTTTGSGTGTQPGQSLLSGLGGAAGDIGSLLLLRSLLGGGSAGSAAGGALGGALGGGLG